MYVISVGNVNPSGRGMNGNVISEQGLSSTLTTNKGEGIKVLVADKK
jgi:DNA (cytosine-5)-methyltransferase 1